MKIRLLPLLSAVAFFSCKGKGDFEASFEKVETETLLADSISIRGLAIDNDMVWYAGSNGKYGRVSLSGGKNFAGVAAQDSLMPEFRAIAQTRDAVLILNAGTPAMLYKISKDGKQSRVVYTEKGEKVFYDSMQFFDDKEGIAIGDPTDGCLSVLITRNGGDTWVKLPCSILPATANGEAAFAASNTNLVVRDNSAWIISGGKRSRVFFSADRGRSWKVFDTPIVQGGEMTGMFSAAFYDDKNGFAVGGDYSRPKMNIGNKIITRDGGKTWQPVGQNTGFGCASCVQYMPGSNGNGLVTVGPSGVYYSYDRGVTWKKVLNDTALHTIRFKDGKTAIAAGENKIVRLKFI